jgi:hypothetical protein
VEIGGSAIRMPAGVFRKASEESGFNALLHCTRRRFSPKPLRPRHVIGFIR